jgi:ornithine cyclodeaminase/alanine dehydrogenase-like protein (mu-crystallin family)
MSKLLVLGDNEVRECLSMAECVEAMEGVLAGLARGELFQPLRPVFRPPGGGGFFGLMPAHRSSEPALYSLKEIVVTPSNPAERGLDAHQGGVLLHDGETGELVALLNASPITEIRTAAVSAVATRALARRDASVVAVLGAGVQSRSHVEAMQHVLPDAEIRVWSRRDEATPERALEGAHVVCTCTTAREPIVRREWLADGAHVNAVGSSVPTTRELDGATVAAASVFVDRRESAENEAGDLLLAAQHGEFAMDRIAAELGEVLVGSHPGRTEDGQLTVFKSLGIGVEDLAAAELAVRRARERGLGVEVDF